MTPLVGLALVASTALPRAGIPAPPVGEAAAVRALPREAADGRAVKLRGVVTHLDPHAGELFLQDATGAVRVLPTPLARGLAAGDEADVEGVTRWAGHTVSVAATRVARIGPAPRPPVAASFDLSPARAGWLDGLLVAARGKVAEARWDRGAAVLKLRGPAGDAEAVVPDLRGPPGRWVGAEVVVWGVCTAGFDDHRRPAPLPRILLADPGRLTVLNPSADPFTAPLVAAREVPDWAGPVADPRDRVRVAGVVTAVRGGQLVFVQDATAAVAVALGEPADVRPGVWVEASGLPVAAGGAARLESAALRPAAAAGPAPEPVPADPGLLAEPRFRGALVRVEGRVGEVARSAGRVRVSVFEGGHQIDAVLEGELPGGVEPGARVAVTGVCAGGRHAAGAAASELLLRSPGDLVVVRAAPSWWSARGAWYAVGGFLAASLAGLAWTLTLRAKVRAAAAAITREFAERARLEEKLRQAAKLEAVGRLAGGVAHDFNNLLTVINGCAEMLAAEPAGPRAAELTADIRRAGERAAALTGQLLTFSRHRVVTPRPVDLNAALADTARLLGRLIGEDIAVRTEYAPGLPPVLAEPGLIGQVVLNLAVNARDAMPHGGTLAIRTGPGDNGRVWFTVSDTGVGMTEEVKARIFEPFFTTKEPGKGTGLGLATVYGIVESLGGTVQLDSTPGTGTTFRVELPAAPAGARPETAPPAAPAPPAPAPAGVVLFVEDDESVRALAALLLEQRGITVIAVDGPAAALRVAEGDRRIDLLLTDVVMPGMGGRELAARVREMRPGIRVVYMSGYTADEVLRRGILDDQVEFLQKPFTPAALLAKVAHALGG